MQINKINDSLAELSNWLEDNLNNNIEKIQILTKLNELIFWIEMYQTKCVEQNNENISM